MLSKSYAEYDAQHIKTHASIIRFSAKTVTRMARPTRVVDYASVAIISMTITIRLFQQGNYSRLASIQGNMIFFFNIFRSLYFQ